MKVECPAGRSHSSQKGGCQKNQSLQPKAKLASSLPASSVVLALCLSRTRITRSGALAPDLPFSRVRAEGKERLGNPRFSHSFLRGELPFPDPFPSDSFSTQRETILCERKESDLRPLSYQDSVLPLNYARISTQLHTNTLLSES